MCLVIGFISGCFIACDSVMRNYRIVPRKGRGLLKTAYSINKTYDRVMGDDLKRAKDPGETIRIQEEETSS